MSFQAGAKPLTLVSSWVLSGGRKSEWPLCSRLASGTEILHVVSQASSGGDSLRLDMETEPKHVVPSGMDTIMCVAIITAGLVAFLCSGHAGVILVLTIFICIWLLCDLMKIYQYYRLGKDPEVVISSGQMPMRPTPKHCRAEGSASSVSK
eukprot:s6216_g2.t1